MPSEKRLSKSTVPTICVIGSRDPLKAGVEKLSTVMPNLRVEIVEGGEHISTLSNPEFLSQMRTFLMENSLASVADSD